MGLNIFGKVIFQVFLVCLLLLSCKPNAVQTQGVLTGDSAKRINALMVDSVKDGYAGSLVVEKDGKLILARGYGYADREEEILMTPNTVVDIGSVTKQFTAAAILRLEEQGRLAVENNISDYFENVPEDKQTITLHQLLTHTAGFPEGLGDDYDAILRDDYINLAMNAKLVSSPGKAYNYSNVGYSLLAAVIEIVTANSYEVYMWENLFEPAGMTKTGYLLPNWRKGDLAHGYNSFVGFSRDTGTPLNYPFAEDGPYWNLRGNGGILSTATNMYKWHRALQGNKILSKTSKEKLLTPFVNEGYEQESYYSYGWVIMPTSRGTLQTHNGGNDVFYADVHRYLDANAFIFISSTTGQRLNATELSWQIAEILFDE